MAIAAVSIHRQDGVAWIVLDRQERKNALDAAAWDSLSDSLEEIEQSAEDRVVVLTGAGNSFCAGSDLRARSSAPMPTGTYLRRIRTVSECAIRLHELTKPTIAAVNGDSVGAGCSLALGCDLIIAADTARFSLVFARRGLTIDLGSSWLLPRLVGLHKAKELALLADVIGADEAERLGLVNRVVPLGELRDVVTDVAIRLCGLAPTALSTTKRLLNHSSSLSLREAVEAECVAQAMSRSTSDALEGSTAFLEKRSAIFRGE